MQRGFNNNTKKKSKNEATTPTKKKKMKTDPLENLNSQEDDEYELSLMGPDYYRNEKLPISDLNRLSQQELDKIEEGIKVWRQKRTKERAEMKKNVLHCENSPHYILTYEKWMNLLPESDSSIKSISGKRTRYIPATKQQSLYKLDKFCTFENFFYNRSYSGNKKESKKFVNDTLELIQKKTSFDPSFMELKNSDLRLIYRLDPDLDAFFLVISFVGIDVSDKEKYQESIDLYFESKTISQIGLDMNILPLFTLLDASVTYKEYDVMYFMCDCNT